MQFLVDNDEILWYNRIVIGTDSKRTKAAADVLEVKFRFIPAKVERRLNYKIFPTFLRRLQCRFAVKRLKFIREFAAIFVRYPTGTRVKKRNSRNVALLKFKSLAAIAVQKRKTPKPLARVTPAF